ncbi:MAG: DUF4293 domain-containing protein [Muribaculaceae bacterium]|nr:DUF4293 domain-containing protein [Muribaculaceae bacterium]
MVIQRWQSVFLLLAAIFMAIFCFVPTAHLYADATLIAHIRPVNYPVFLTINVLIAVLLFIAIFLYKNMKRQKTVTLVSMMLIAVSGVCGGFILYGGDNGGGRIEMGGSVVLLIGALVAALMAYRHIRKDENLLKSYDRLR